MSVHPTWQPPCPSSEPCSPACPDVYATTYEPPDSQRETITSPPPDFDERATILPPGLVASWEEAERG